MTSLLTRRLLACSAALLAAALAARGALGQAAPSCRTAADCAAGRSCHLVAGHRCCWPRTCSPPCAPLEECVKTEGNCSAPGCDCPPSFTCEPAAPGRLPVGLPPASCRPPCTNGTLCLLEASGGAYSCQPPTAGCWTWWDCTRGGDKTNSTTPPSAS